MQSTEKIQEGNDRASCELCEETSRVGIGAILCMAWREEKKPHKPVP